MNNIQYYDIRSFGLTSLSQRRKPTKLLPETGQRQGRGGCCGAENLKVTLEFIHGPVNTPLKAERHASRAFAGLSPLMGRST